MQNPLDATTATHKIEIGPIFLDFTTASGAKVKLGLDFLQNRVLIDCAVSVESRLKGPLGPLELVNSLAGHHRDGQSQADQDGPHK